LLPALQAYFIPGVPSIDADVVGKLKGSIESIGDTRKALDNAIENMGKQQNAKGANLNESFLLFARE